MGDYANDRLRSWLRAGMPEPRVKRKPIPRVMCDCGKECVGQSGLMQHQKAKHGYKYSMQEILLLSSQERFEQIID